MLAQVAVILLLAKTVEPAALGAACSTGNTDCTGDTPGQYSECDATPVCVCQTGYADASGVCQPDLTSTCSATGECQAGAGGTYSECASLACACSSGYTAASGVCQPDIGSACANTAECQAGTGGTQSTCSTNCACSTGYTAVSGVCQADLGTTCSVNADCTAQDTNSECSSSTCACQSTHYDDNGDSVAGGTCQTGLVLAASCSSVTAVAQDSACSSGVANSECTGTSGAETCQCVNGYYTSSSACAAVLGSSCSTDTECVTTRGLANSFCSSTSVCACQSGYTASNNLCNSGAELVATLWTLVLSVFIALY